MYIFELLIKKLTNKHKSENHFQAEDKIFENDENCEHVFMPLDSTGEKLSCTNCGFVVDRKSLHRKNFFNS